jgi:hypothetical protein
MTKVSRALAAGFACVVFSVTSFAGGPFGIIHVGKWQGAAYTTDKGAFSHCTAAAKFDSGLAIILAQNANRSWIIGVAAPSWPFRDKQPVKLVLTFDGQAQFDVSGTAARDKAVVGVLSSQAISALGKAHQLVVTATNQTLQFDLAAAGNVVPSIEYCVDKINTNGIAAAGDFSNPKAKPSTAKASAKSDDEPAEKPAEPDKLVSVSGSGFVVSKNAHIVTNNHVVTDCVGDIHGNLVGQAPVKLRVVSADEENDLALLQGTKKGHRDDPRQRGEFRRPGGCDRLSAAWASHLRPDGDDGDHQFLGGAAQRYALLADQRPGSAGQQRRPITRQQRQYCRRGQREARCVAHGKGDGRHSAKHQFRHQDRSAARFSQQQRGAVSNRRARRRNEDRRHCQRGADIHHADFMLGASRRERPQVIHR